MIALLKNNGLKAGNNGIFLFELYQSSNRNGNWLSLVKNPYEGEAPFKALYDGKAKAELTAQIKSLQEKALGSSSSAGKIETVTLFRCINRKTCKDIRFGTFPSEEEHTGYCMSASEGCANKPIIVHREEMKSFFYQIPE